MTQFHLLCAIHLRHLLALGPLHLSASNDIQIQCYVPRLYNMQTNKRSALSLSCSCLWTCAHTLSPVSLVDE